MEAEHLCLEDLFALFSLFKTWKQCSEWCYRKQAITKAQVVPGLGGFFKVSLEELGQDELPVCMSSVDFELIVSFGEFCGGNTVVPGWSLQAILHPRNEFSVCVLGKKSNTVGGWLHYCQQSCLRCSQTGSQGMTWPRALAEEKLHVSLRHSTTEPRPKTTDPKQHMFMLKWKGLPAAPRLRFLSRRKGNSTDAGWWW